MLKVGGAVSLLGRPIVNNEFHAADSGSQHQRLKVR